MSTSVSDYTHRAPDAVAPLAELMASYRAPWALCGGWAIDAWLGRQTREHGDVDISVFAQDHAALYEHLRGWQLVAHSPQVPDDTNLLWEGQPLQAPAHLHGRPDSGEPVPDQLDDATGRGFWLDVQFDERDGDDWVLSREPLVRVPLREAVTQSRWGLPVVVPEVLLYFKARDLRRRDRIDFAEALPEMNAEQRAWLREAVALLKHPWLGELMRDGS